MAAKTSYDSILQLRGKIEVSLKIGQNVQNLVAKTSYDSILQLQGKIAVSLKFGQNVVTVNECVL